MSHGTWTASWAEHHAGYYLHSTSSHHSGSFATSASQRVSKNLGDLMVVTWFSESIFYACFCLFWCMRLVCSSILSILSSFTVSVRESLARESLCIDVLWWAAPLRLPPAPPPCLSFTMMFAMRSRSKRFSHSISVIFSAHEWFTRNLTLFHHDFFGFQKGEPVRMWLG